MSRRVVSATISPKLRPGGIDVQAQVYGTGRRVADVLLPSGKNPTAFRLSRSLEFHVGFSPECRKGGSWEGSLVSNACCVTWTRRRCFVVVFCGMSELF